MKLFIANATRQVVTFTSRLPERSGVVAIPIPIGGQAQFAGDLTQAEIDSVIAANAIYGLVPVADAERQGGFSGLCYSVDKPISEDRLRGAMAKRVAVVTQMGHEQRKNAAVVVHDQVERHLSEHRELGNINGIDLEVIEQDRSGLRAASDGYGERFSVHRAREDAPPPRRGRRRAA